MRDWFGAKSALRGSLMFVGLVGASWSHAQAPASCAALPDHATLKSTLQKVVKEGKEVNSGLGNDFWATVVDRDGIVCAVVFSGADRGSQWPGSRLIATEKAYTANAFSNTGFALSTANLYFPTQPGQSLFGLQHSAPPNTDEAYEGKPEAYGQANDPLVGKTIGGLIVFGGGLPLYDKTGKLVGGVGTSGDTACADHVVAWKVRHALNLDAVPAGVAPGGNDNLVLDVQNGVSAGGFGHPNCTVGKPADEAISKLAQQFPTGAAE